MLKRWLLRLHEPVDGSGLATFRVLFGSLMFVAAIRFVAYGWVDELYVEPSFHFTYYGFEWIEPWPRAFMFAHFAALALAALSLALGFFPRLSAACFCLLFWYVELLDKAAYLNHYYLVSLLSLLLMFLPTQRAQAPRGAYWLLRGQVGLVYVFAGLAKLNADWLFAAEPLSTWLSARSHYPVLGPVLAEPFTAFAMSWAGAVFDLSVPFLLASRKTRAYAFAAAVVFHITIWLLFPVGVFSFVMLLAVTVFFDPAWPRRWLPSRWQPLIFGITAWRDSRLPVPSSRAVRRWAVAMGAAYLTVQALVPLRFLLYPGFVNWTEQGFRFAWRVMLIEKAGQVEFTVRCDEAPFIVYPRSELTRLQYRQMATQPDMILEFAHHLRDRYQKRGCRNVEVTADSWVAFNGRKSQRLVDPERDLAKIRRSFAPRDWILPLESARSTSRL